MLETDQGNCQYRMFNNSVSWFGGARRFYRNFTNSPTSKPGFMLLETVQKLTRKVLDKRPAGAAFPEALGNLFDKSKSSRKLQNQVNLKGPLRPEDIESAVSSHPNQIKPNILNLLNVTPTPSFNIFGSSSPILSLKSIAESLQSQFDSEAMECANVLKKRRRRMRGHKHKKRLKERRHKADK